MDAVHRLNGSGFEIWSLLRKDALWIVRTGVELVVAPARACDPGPASAPVSIAVVFGGFHYKVAVVEAAAIVADVGYLFAIDDAH